MRFLRFWTFCLGLAGVFVIIAPCIVGQRTRELIDIDELTTPQTSTLDTAPALPGTGGRILLPYSLNPAAGSAVRPAAAVPGRTAPEETDPEEPVRPLPLEIPVPSLQPSEAAEQPDTPVILVEEAVESVLEDNTEEEHEEREMLAQRRRAEEIVDPDRRKIELDRVEMAETNYQNRVARRKANEVGANEFYFPRLKEQYLKDGWCQLFDGHTEYGWKTQTEGHYAGGKFTFGQHEIHSDPYYPGMIYTQIPFGNISIRLNYWAEKDSEAYLLMKTPPNPEDLNTSCYTFVLNSRFSSRPRGIPLGRHELPPQSYREEQEFSDAIDNIGEGAWHTITVRFEGNEYQVWLDKRPVENYFDQNPIASGHIALLVTKGRVRFRNILWQPNQAVSVFSEGNLGEIPWQSSDEAEVSGNNYAGIRLRNGTIESKELFKNYMLQMEYQQGLNAGQASLFVRSLPGKENTGYEISLQNYPRWQDRETAVGVDAGAFRQFPSRYQKSRYLRVPERQWTYLTVLAIDRQFQTWVNGVPVNHIEDRRNTQEATGPFLEPGTIRFHAPRENMSFQIRHLLVSPIVP